MAPAFERSSALSAAGNQLRTQHDIAVPFDALCRQQCELSKSAHTLQFNTYNIIHRNSQLITAPLHFVAIRQKVDC